MNSLLDRIGDYLTKIKEQELQNQEGKKKRSFTVKFLYTAFWTLAFCLCIFYLYFRICNANDIKIGSHEIIFFLTLLLINLILFLFLTIKDTGNVITILIIRFSSIMLLLTMALFFQMLYFIVDLTFIYFILLIIFTLLWIALNNSKDIRAVKFANSFIAVFLAIALHVNTYIWTIMKIKSNITTLGVPINGVELQYEQIVNIIVCPILIMTAVCGLYYTCKSSRLKDNKTVD